MNEIFLGKLITNFFKHFLTSNLLPIYCPIQKFILKFEFEYLLNERIDSASRSKTMAI